MYPEVDADLNREAAAGSTMQDDEETEEEEFADWRALSLKSMWECWDNEEDAVYDNL